MKFVMILFFQRPPLETGAAVKVQNICYGLIKDGQNAKGREK